MRLFVGLALPQDIRFRLSLLCCGLPNIRWVPQENMHLTLRFIGEVDNGVMQDIDAALAAVRAPRFALSIAGVGHFGKEKNVRVIWAGVERSAPLQHLHDKIESAVVRTGQPPDGQKFSPHVTLSRVKTPPPSGKLLEFLAANNLFRAQPFEVTHFTLFSSFPSSEGSIYRAEESYELSRL